MIFVPSILAFGVIVAAYVNLGAKIATLRHDGVLKRIRTTPLPAGAYLSGVLGSTAATTLAITACTAVIGWLAFGAVPRAAGLAEIAGGLALGVVCFGSLGLALSSVARSAESASPLANATLPAGGDNVGYLRSNIQRAALAVGRHRAAPGPRARPDPATGLHACRARPGQ